MATDSYCVHASAMTSLRTATSTSSPEGYNCKGMIASHAGLVSGRSASGGLPGGD